MKTQKTAKQVKEVNVLYTYKFTKINRICFTVLSSNGQEKYNTCFDKDENHGSCTCPALRGCYHLDQLKARAQEYFQSRQPAQPVQPEKANPVAEAEAFIAKVQEEKLARGAALMQSGKASLKGYSGLHNSNEGHFEKHGDRLIPMR